MAGAAQPRVHAGSRRTIAAAVLLAAVTMVGTGPAQAASPTATPSPAPNQTFGLAPDKCGIGCWADQPNTLAVSYLADVNVSPHILRVGDKLTATVSLFATGGCYGVARCVGDWHWPHLGREPTVCKDRDLKCTWEINSQAQVQTTAPGGAQLGWSLLSMGWPNPVGPALSQDYYGVLPPLANLVDGTCKDLDGRPVSGVNVEIDSSDGAGLKIPLRSDRSGNFYATPPKGDYVAGASYSGASNASVLLQPTAISLASGTTVHINCLLQDRRVLEVSENPDNLVADGTGSSIASITEIWKGSRQPIVDDPTPVVVEPPLDVYPPALICDQTDKLVWPKTAGAPLNYDGGQFKAMTDSQGRVQFKVWMGAQAYEGTNHRDWLLDASYPSQAGLGQFGRPIVLTANSGAQTFPVGTAAKLVGRLLGLGAPSINIFKVFKPSAAEMDQDLDTLLAWLPSVLPPGYDYGPVHTSDNSHVGVVVFPSRIPGIKVTDFLAGPQKGSAPPLFAHVLDPGFLQATFTNGILAQVTGAPAVDFAKVNALDIASLPPIELWAQDVLGATTTITAVKGHIGARASEPFTYLGFPLPPNAGDANFDPCVGTAAALGVTTMSPVRLVFTDPSGRRFGLDKNGTKLTEIASARLLSSGDTNTYLLPPAQYSIDIFGTGSGPAHVVVSAPGKVAQVFALTARSGASGHLLIGPAGPAGKLTFDGHDITASRVGLRVTGMPSDLRAGDIRRVNLAVVDTLGRRVSGALVTFEGYHFTSTGLSDAHGTVSITVDPFDAGTMAYKATAPGYADSDPSSARILGIRPLALAAATDVQNRRVLINVGLVAGGVLLFIVGLFYLSRRLRRRSA